MNRRETLQVLGGVTLALLAGCSKGGGSLKLPLALPEGSKAIGQAWLKANPSDLKALSQALFGADRPPEKADLDALLKKIRADYAAGRLARLEGWYLAETEARLHALGALTA